jgi:hypothetical protein
MAAVGQGRAEFAEHKLGFKRVDFLVHEGV